MFPMIGVRRKVVGSCTVVKEVVKKRFESKNILREIVERKTFGAIELDCGHKILASDFNKVPTNNTMCYECEMEFE